MAITLNRGGEKVKVENAAVEAAFAAAIAEAPAERGVLVTLASAPVSKVASALGLGEDRPTGVGNATRRVYPGGLVARVAEILGADLVGKVVCDPIADAAADRRAAEIYADQARIDAEFAAARVARRIVYGSRGWANDRPCTCGRCGSEVARFEGTDCDVWREGDIRRDYCTTLCRSCLAAVGPGRSPFYSGPAPRNIDLEISDPMAVLEAEADRARAGASCDDSE